VLSSEKESQRVYVMERVVADDLTARQGPRSLKLSERHVKRLMRGPELHRPAFDWPYGMFDAGRLSSP